MKQLLARTRKRFDRLIQEWRPDEYSARFIAFCQRKWPVHPKPGSSVVLMGLFSPKPAIYCNAYVANYLSQRTGAAIECFKFIGQKNRTLQRVYEGFGARLGLDLSWAAPDRPKAKELANTIFASLKTKWDVLNIAIDDLKIGDLVYDTYLRFKEEPTVKLDDERLRDVILEHLLIYFALKSYLSRKRPVAFIADDFGYHECGIPTRVMLRAKVPVYIVCYGPQFFVYQLYSEAASGWHNFPIRWPYHRYRELFRALPPERQAWALGKGRTHLDSKLAGQIDGFTLKTLSAYGATGDRVFPQEGPPRVLVLLHDFIDSPHGYRWMLFPDFYEWLCFLLEQSAKTPFDWYFKPHPCVWDSNRRAVNESNARVLTELQQRFPHAKFLEPLVSNRQLIQEGISAMFTMYGTAGHEFARLGVPVVNAGDNPHIAYAFNFNPTSIEEYAALIRRADQLSVETKGSSIEEYYYMNYFYFADQLSGEANPIATDLYKNPAWEREFFSKAGYDTMMTSDSPERDAALKSYFDDFFAGMPKAGGNS